MKPIERRELTLTRYGCCFRLRIEDLIWWLTQQEKREEGEGKLWKVVLLGMIEGLLERKLWLM